MAWNRSRRKKIASAVLMGLNAVVFDAELVTLGTLDISRLFFPVTWLEWMISKSNPKNFFQIFKWLHEVYFLIFQAFSSVPWIRSVNCDEQLKIRLFFFFFRWSNIGHKGSGTYVRIGRKKRKCFLPLILPMVAFRVTPELNYSNFPAIRNPLSVHSISISRSSTALIEYNFFFTRNWRCNVLVCNI